MLNERIENVKEYLRNCGLFFVSSGQRKIYAGNFARLLDTIAKETPKSEAEDSHAPSFGWIGYITHSRVKIVACSQSLLYPLRTNSLLFSCIISRKFPQLWGC